MYAIVEVGGRQWRVEPGTRLEVNRLSTAVGKQHTVERVLFAQNNQGVHVGRPYVKGASVVYEVLAHTLGPKAISYHFRRRENWRKTIGHRQPLTRLVVKEIRFAGERAPAEAPVKVAVKSQAKKPTTTRATKSPAKKESRNSKKASA